MPTRIEKLYDILVSNHLDALALNLSPTLFYLTNIQGHLTERPSVVIFIPSQTPVVILPEFEVGNLKKRGLECRIFSYGEDPSTWVDAFKEACKSANLDGKKIGIEQNWFRALELFLLQEGAPRAQFIPVDKIISTLRMVKDVQEIETMRKAAKIAEQAFLDTLQETRIGMTEREFALKLTLNLIRNGSESASFSAIVGSGPNGANPHAGISDRKLADGDLVVVDWGALYQGYSSDITRTLAIGNIPDEFKRIASIVAEANAAGRRAAKQGNSAGQVDQAARTVIDDADYGQYFTHRLGHGLGLEVHEEPYLFKGNPLILQAGMTHSVEPGIYIPGVGGVRIEDDVVVGTEEGLSLTELPRELFYIR